MNFRDKILRDAGLPAPPDQKGGEHAAQLEQERQVVAEIHCDGEDKFVILRNPNGELVYLREGDPVADREALLAENERMKQVQKAAFTVVDYNDALLRRVGVLEGALRDIEAMCDEAAGPPMPLWASKIKRVIDPALGPLRLTYRNATPEEAAALAEERGMTLGDYLRSGAVLAGGEAVPPKPLPCVCEPGFRYEGSGACPRCSGVAGGEAAPDFGGKCPLHWPRYHYNCPTCEPGGEAGKEPT